MIDFRELTEQVHKVLLQQWDPIGVADEPAAQDEYDSYALAIARLVMDGEPADAIARRLLSIERERMELPGNESVASRAAVSLIALIER